MMNVFRLAGDMCHVISIVLLILRIRMNQNAMGISMKTQELYLVVFVTRYLDLFTTFYSVYNSCMKVLYIASTAYILYLVKGTEPFKSTYEATHDSFLHWQFAVAPCAVVALLVSLYTGGLEDFSVMEVSRVCRRSALSLLFCAVSAHIDHHFTPSTPFIVHLELFALPRGTGHRPTAHRPAKIPGSGESNRTLRFLSRSVQNPLHLQLGV